jgi:ABC-type nitrate/sulfonate/bicarbonate transport system permease component
VGLGLGALTLVALALSPLGLLRPAALIAVVAAGVLLALRPLAATLRRPQPARRHEPLAIALGALIALSPFGRRQGMAVVVALYNVPIIAIAPLLQVLLPGDGPQIATAAICVFFTTLLGTVTGLRSADRSRLDVVHAAGGGFLAALLKVRVRYAVPAVFAGLAVGIPYALVGAIIGEFLGGRAEGLGAMLVQALSNLDAARVWGICLIVGGLGAIGLALATWVSRRLFPWGESDVGGQAPAAAEASLPRRILAGASTLVVATIVVLAVWIGGTEAFGLEPFVVKMPWDVWSYLTSDDPFDVASRSDLFAGLGRTLWNAVAGCLLGIGAGLLIALAIVRSDALRVLLRPLLTVISCVPHLAFVPILAVALGRGLTTTLVTAALISLLPTVVNLEAGLRSTPRSLRDVLHVGAAGGRQRLLKLELPVALPYLFTSLRIAAPWSLLGVLYAEWLATGGGIGSFMVEQSVNGGFDATWAAAVLVTGCAVALYLLVEFLERRAFARYAPERLT